MLNTKEGPLQFNPNKHWIQTRIEATSACLICMKFWASSQHHIKRVVSIWNPGSGEVQARGSEVQGWSQLHGELEVSLGYTRHCLGHRSQNLGIKRESWYVLSMNRQQWSIKSCLNDQGYHIAFKLQDKLWINIFFKEYNKIQILHIFSNFPILSWITPYK